MNIHYKNKISSLLTVSVLISLLLTPIVASADISIPTLDTSGVGSSFDSAGAGAGDIAPGALTGDGGAQTNLQAGLGAQLDPNKDSLSAVDPSCQSVLKNAIGIISGGPGAWASAGLGALENTGENLAGSAVSGAIGGAIKGAASLIPGGSIVTGVVGGAVGGAAPQEVHSANEDTIVNQLKLLNCYTKVNQENIDKQTKGTDAHSLWEVLRDEGIVPALKALGKTFAKNLIDQITGATVDWINGNFTDRPAFVSNPGQFLADTANITAGDIIAGTQLNFLCQPFQLEVKAALGLNINLPTFQRRITCTFTDIQNNALYAAKNSSAMWDAWLTLTNDPQNTPFGAYLTAQNEINLQTEEKTTNIARDRGFGSGSLSMKACTKRTYDHGTLKSTDELTPGFEDKDSNNGVYEQDGTYTGYNIDCKITTPGAIVTNLLGFSATTDQRTDELRYALSDGLDAVLSALLNKAVQLTVGKIQNGILSGSVSGSDLSSTLQDIQNNYNSPTNGYNVSGYGDAFGTGYLSNFGVKSSTPVTNSNLTGPQQTLIDEMEADRSIENQLENNLKSAQKTLSLALPYFNDPTIGAIVCNNSYQLWQKAQDIRVNIADNIIGDPLTLNTDAFYRTEPVIEWSLETIANAINVAEFNIQSIDTLESSTTAAVTTSDLNNVSSSLAALPLHSDTAASANENTKGWLQQNVAWYAGPTTQCPVNLGNII